MAQARWTHIRRADNGTVRVWTHGDDCSDLVELLGQDKAAALKMANGDHGQRVHDTPGPQTPIAATNAGL